MHELVIPSQTLIFVYQITFHIMKNILSLLSLLLLAASLQAQTGANCQQAIPLGGSTVHAQLDAGSLWFKFVAPSAQLALRLSGPDFALDTAHAHGLAIYDGSCPGLDLLGKRILAQAPGQNSISGNADLNQHRNEFVINRCRDFVGRCPQPIVMPTIRGATGSFVK